MRILHDKKLKNYRKADFIMEKIFEKGGRKLSVGLAAELIRNKTVLPRQNGFVVMKFIKPSKL